MSNIYCLSKFQIWNSSLSWSFQINSEVFSDGPTASSHSLLHLPFTIIFSFCFLGLHLQHMEVPRLGSNQSCSYQITPQPQKHRIQAVSVIYTTGHGNVRSLTHWTRSGIKPTSSGILVKFISTEPQQELLQFFLDNSSLQWLSCLRLILFFFFFFLVPPFPAFQKYKYRESNFFCWTN